MTKNKPFPKWVEEIDCPIIKKKVKNNFDYEYSSNNLCFAFRTIWSKSPEGFKYWDSIMIKSPVAKNCYHKDFAHLDQSSVEFGRRYVKTPEANYDGVDDPISHIYGKEFIPKSSLITRKRAFSWGLIPCCLFFLVSFLIASYFREPLLAILISMGYVLGFSGALTIFSNNFPK